MASLTFKLITPEKIAFRAESVTSVTVPTVTGEITVLPGHIPLVSQIGHGELIVRDNQEHSFALSGGFVSVANNQVEVLAESAMHADEIDLEKAEEARVRAAKLREEAVGEMEVAEASAALERALTQLRVANRKRRHHV
jgi:F-type H+-transporting ATPase subunit epsilon